MSQQMWVLAVVVFVVALATSSEADAWPGYHVGVTHVGLGGVQHYGRTGYAGPLGAGSVSHYGATGGSAFGGGYHYGATAAGGVRYGGAAYGGVRYGGYQAGAVGVRGGFARRW